MQSLVRQLQQEIEKDPGRQAGYMRGLAGGGSLRCGFDDVGLALRKAASEMMRGAAVRGRPN